MRRLHLRKSGCRIGRSTTGRKLRRCPIRSQPPVGSASLIRKRPAEATSMCWTHWRAQHGMLAAPAATSTDPFEGWRRVPDPEAKPSGGSTRILDSLAASMPTAGQRAATIDPVTGLDLSKYPAWTQAPQASATSAAQGQVNRVDPVTGLDLSKYPAWS